MSRHFNWQPSEIDDMPVEDLLEYFDDATEFLKAENEARNR